VDIAMRTAIRNCTFAYKCDKKWDELVATLNPNERYCGTCEKNVYFCETNDDFAAAILLNRCVAVSIEDRTAKVEMKLLGIPAMSRELKSFLDDNS
jgi:hypothetical protein